MTAIARSSAADALPTGSGTARSGFGLLAVLLVMLLSATVVAAAGMLGINTVLVGAFANRQSLLAAAADDGLEQARARMNGDRRLYTDSAFTALETAASVQDAAGRTVPGVRRTTWVGPAGIATGQYGVFGAVVVEVTDGAGNRVVRREAVNQESFAKYAWFTDNEGGNIYFAGGDQIQGPVFSNDDIRIDASGATFWGLVRTARSIIGRSYGVYKQGYREAVARIPMPVGADLARLRGYATAGHTVFTPQTNPPRDGQAALRIEFLTVDLNGNGRPDADEAFIRVYESNNYDWLVADSPPQGPENTYNCGHLHSDGRFYTAKAHEDWHFREPRNSHSADVPTAVLRGTAPKCYLGGDSALTNGFKSTTTGADSVPVGDWLPYPGTPDARLAGRADAAYLFPISHALNPEFKGVIFVDGKVAISGVVRGHVTVASTRDIIIADDITYAIDRGFGGCEDLLGLYAAGNILLADNLLNAPAVVGKATTAWAWNDTWTSFDDSNAEFVDAVVMALGSFRGENYDQGSRAAQPCETRPFGRGCLYLTGGIIQGVRGAVGLTNGTGYNKRYSYDKCAAVIPPPYFPTTGHFEKGQYFEVNASGFDMASYTGQLMARP